MVLHKRQQLYNQDGPQNNPAPVSAVSLSLTSPIYSADELGFMFFFGGGFPLQIDAMKWSHCPQKGASVWWNIDCTALETPLVNRNAALPQSLHLSPLAPTIHPPHQHPSWGLNDGPGLSEELHLPTKRDDVWMQLTLCLMVLTQSGFEPEVRNLLCCVQRSSSRTGTIFPYCVTHSIRALCLRALVAH